jgi:predicted DNA-binding transcriptional regulator AlpA
MDTTEKPVSTAAAAQYLGISERTLRKYQRQGNGPPCARLGRRKIYLLSEIHEWLRKGGQRQPQSDVSPTNQDEKPQQRDRFRGHPEIVARRRAYSRRRSPASAGRRPTVDDGSKLIN